jgi:non-heme chloroperoxidase
MTADTPPIVLIHGLWMTPKSWDTWAERYRERGHQVVVPGWPGIDNRGVADVRANPEPLKGIGLAQIADHYESILRAFPQKPIIMGHSFGGVLTQMLADRGLGAACVGVATGPTAGVPLVPFSAAVTGFPTLSKPWARNGASPITRRQFHYAFGNDLPRAESDRVWEEQAVNAYNRVLFEGVLALFNEGRGVTKVDYTRADRAPLLVIMGGEDHVVPPAIGKALVKKYRRTGSPSVVEYKEYPGRTHRMVGQEGWEEIADFALGWSLAHAVTRA